MCRLESILLQTNILFYAKLAIAIYNAIAGLSFASDVHINQAFGLAMRTVGTGLFWMGLFSGLVCLPHRWGTIKHNRFALAFTFFVDLFVLSFQLFIGLQIYSYLAPVFPKDLQADCLLNTPTIYSPAACQAFYFSDRVAGMRLYWEYWHSRKADPTAFQKITILEGDTCCGFFAPFLCSQTLQTNPFPADRDLTGIPPAYTSQRVICGPHPNFYQQTDECADFFDIVAGTVGGCNYDLPLGYCIANVVQPTSSGCASEVEDFMVSQISGTAYFTLGTTIFNLYAMLLACCMWWKRKVVDVFPDDSEQLAAKLGKINWKAVKDQFEVKPMHNVLVKKGFLPETDKARLKYLSQQQSELEAQTSMHMSAKPVEEGKQAEGEEGPLPPEMDPSPPAAAAGDTSDAAAAPATVSDGNV